MRLDGLTSLRGVALRPAAAAAPGVCFWRAAAQIPLSGASGAPRAIAAHLSPDGPHNFRSMMGRYRKTDQRRSASVPAELAPDYVLRLVLPRTLAYAVAPGPTGLPGVTVLRGDVVETRGRRWQWVVEQTAAYVGGLARAAAQQVTMQAVLTRDAYPGLTAEAPWRPAVRRSLALIVVPWAAVVIPRALDPAMIVPLRP